MVAIDESRAKAAPLYVRRAFDFTPGVHIAWSGRQRFVIAILTAGGYMSAGMAFHNSHDLASPQLVTAPFPA